MPSEGRQPSMDTQAALPHPAARDEASWSRIDVLLRRLAVSLTYAADGRSPTLDNTLGDLRQQLREPLAEEVLKLLLGELTDAVRALDVLPGAEPVASSMFSPGELLLVLIDRLQLDDASAVSLEQIRAAIAHAAADATTLAEQAEALANLVNRHYRQASGQRATAELLLTHVTRQLDELAHYLNGDKIDHHDSAEARQELNRDLVGEIDALGSCMQNTHDMATLHTEIQDRLGMITTHLKNFHAREDAREHAWQLRSSKMSQRIHDLERAAQSMEINLRQEHRLASTDPLTGIHNRLVFEQRIAQACRERATDVTDTCLLVLDIDRFKHINDSFGHAAGDRALRIVAGQLQAALRPDDLLARYGGEEFVVMLPATDAKTALHIAERLRNRIEHTDFRCKQQPVQITLSCGLTALRHGDTPASVFERADRALYRAKHRGRNCCESD